VTTGAVNVAQSLQNGQADDAPVFVALDVDAPTHATAVEAERWMERVDPDIYLRKQS
jgi:hypothetical protein